MKNLFTYIIFFALLAFTSCKENEEMTNYDTYIGYLNYNENDEYLSHEKYYYKNGLIVKLDHSPSYIWNYTYDTKNNLIKFEDGMVSVFLYDYDSQNRRIKEQQFVSDTLYLETHKLYKDTFLMKEIFLNKAGDTLSNTIYYYNTTNQLDSVIGKWDKIYHYYTSDSHKVVSLQNNIKHSEKYTTFENGLISTYKESYFTQNGIAFQGQEETRKYDGMKNLVRLEITHYELYENSTIYRDYRYSYNSNNTMNKSELYDADSKLILYIHYIYLSDKKEKKQSYDANGNKTLYTNVEYAYMK
jgi:hypothetical protein